MLRDVLDVALGNVRIPTALGIEHNVRSVLARAEAHVGPHLAILAARQPRLHLLHQFARAAGQTVHVLTHEHVMRLLWLHHGALLTRDSRPARSPGSSTGRRVGHCTDWLPANGS